MLIYSRNVNVKIELLNSNTIKATGFTENTADGAPKSERFKVEIKVDVNNFEIVSVDNVEMDVINPSCCELIPQLHKITGISITSGYSRKIKEIIGGNDGCIHLVELLIEMGRCVSAGYSHGYIIKNDGVKAALEKYSDKNGILCRGIADLNNKIINKG